MKSKSTRNLILSAFLSAILMPLAAGVMAAPPDAKDDGTGWCDGLDKKGGLFSTCLRAHSAQNLVDHLMAVGAGGAALSNATAAVEQATSAFEELAGPGNSVPGLGDACFSAADYVGIATDEDINSVTWWPPICKSFGGDPLYCDSQNNYFQFVEPLWNCIVGQYSVQSCPDADFYVNRDVPDIRVCGLQSSP